MNNGFITLHRKILDWEWYDDLNTTRLFIHCLLRSNHKNNNWRGITIKRGSFLTSIKTLSTETRLSTSQIRTSIKKLKSTNDITIKSQAQYSVITALNYDLHQDNDKVRDKPATNKSQTSDKPVTTNNNDNNDNNVTITNKYLDEFDIIWSMYGKKGGKKKSFLKFKKLSLKDISEMKSQIPNYVDSTPDIQYRKNLETYIYNESWKDAPSNSYIDKYAGAI
jgi:hypothetical protein